MGIMEEMRGSGDVWILDSANESYTLGFLDTSLKTVGG